MCVLLRRAAVAAAACLSVAIPNAASAHGVAGNRFFPATLAIDDPFVADELSLPTVQALKNADNAREVDLAFEYSKRFTEYFGVSVGSAWTHLHPGGSGFQNLETTFKYQLITNAPHEFILSAGLSIEWGHTGALRVGAERFTTVTPTIYFGKGFGDLPDSAGMLRPFAITGQIGYGVPSAAKRVSFSGLDEDSGLPTFDMDRRPQHLKWGASLQYSLPYLKANVRDFGLPDFVNHLIPIVEASFSTPTANNVNREKTTGTINPGVIWAGQKVQVGIEAVFPVNRESGKHVGVLAQLHWYLDDIFPNSIGKPLF